MEQLSFTQMSNTFQQMSEKQKAFSWNLQKPVVYSFWNSVGISQSLK